MAKLRVTKKQIFVGVGVIVLLGAAIGAGFYVRWLQTKDKGPTGDKQAQNGLDAPPPVPTEVVDAQQLALQGKTEEANKKIQEGLNKSGVSDDDKYDLYIQQGVVYTNAKPPQPQKALDQFRLAEKITLDFTVAHLIAEQLEALGDKAGAIDYYKKALGLLNKKDPLYQADKEIYEKKVLDLGGTL